MVPEFENGAFALRVGDIAIVESPFGFHVVRRDE
jgi:parvulin-like peptidyl-prolyl isomerase